MPDTPTDANKGTSDQGHVPGSTFAERKLKNDEPINKEGQATDTAKNPEPSAVKPWKVNETLAKWWEFIKSPDFTNPAIAIATIVIAVATVLTFSEVHSGSTQTDRIIKADERLAVANERSAGAMERSAKQAVLASQLQVRIARAEHGAAFVSLTPWMGFYREGSRFFAIMAVHNEKGDTGASLIQIAARMELRDSIPSDSPDYVFSDSDFKYVSPSTLPGHEKGLLPITRLPDENNRRRFESYAKSEHINMSNPIPPSQYPVYKNRPVYVWGKIRYQDFLGELVPDVPFCRYISSDNIIAAKEGEIGGAGPGDDCKTKQPKAN